MLVDVLVAAWVFLNCDEELKIVEQQVKDVIVINRYTYILPTRVPPSGSARATPVQVLDIYIVGLGALAARELFTGAAP